MKNDSHFVQADTPKGFFTLIKKIYADMEALENLDREASRKEKAIADAPEKEPPTDEKLDSLIEEINEENK